MRRFLRTHRVALLAVAVLVPALGVLAVVVPIAERAAVLPTRTEVAVGEAATVAGVRFSVRASQEFPGGSGTIELPPDAAMVAAVIDVEPQTGGEVEGCTIELTAPGPAGEAEWSVVYDTTPYGYARGDAFATGCDPDATAPYSIEAVFLAPTGTLDGAASLTVTLTGGDRPREVRLRLPESAPPPE